MSGIRIESTAGWDWVRLELGRANAVGPEFLAATDEALDRLTQTGPAPGFLPDGASRPVLFTGQGSAFSAGLDLPTLLELDRTAMGAFLVHFDRVFRRIATLPRPTLAVINGHAVAGGIVLALACDRRLAASRTPKGTPYVVGLKESAIGLPLPEVVAEIIEVAIPVGSARNEIVLTGSLYSPEDAVTIGLIDQVVDAEELASVASRIAESFTQSTGETVARLKRQFRARLHEGFARQRNETEFLDAWFSAETQRRVRAVVESLRR